MGKSFKSNSALRFAASAVIAAMAIGGTQVFAASSKKEKPVEDVAYNVANAGNPIIPGYFADPTIKKFGDTYYIYSTTDGSGAGFGPAQLWTSKDMVNWTLMNMNWPDSHWIWAPDVMQNQHDGKYYYVYCQPCQIHVGVSDTPHGPWQNILGESEAVLVPDRFVTNAITLDGQTFVDDDGSIYMYWGTWGIYKGFGCGAGKLTPDMKSFTETRLIPNTEVTDFFEAPFVFKRNGKYYFLYSSGHCEDHSYRVQYAVADQPLGPYTYKGCILETNADGTIHGPGHNSVMKEGDNYYIVYHRHDNPHSNRGFHRQIAIDKLEFDKKGNILPVKPTHKGVSGFAPSIIKSEDLALGKPVKASSYYDDDFRPEYAVDNNNGTLWRPKGFESEWIEIDLQEPSKIGTVLIQPEYGTHFYQYIVETSNDGQNWEVFADKTNNRLATSPYVDFGNTEARYVRVTFTGSQKRGFGGAVWNIKVYPQVEDAMPQQWLGLTASDFEGKKWKNNQGMLGGAFDLIKGSAFRVRKDGRDALELAPNSTLEFTNPNIKATDDHTFSMMMYKDGRWQNANSNFKVDNGSIKIYAGNEPIYINNLRYYNWKLEPSELAYNSQCDIVRNRPAAKESLGKVISINADDYKLNDTLFYFPNKGVVEGHFVMQRTPLVPSLTPEQMQQLSEGNDSTLKQLLPDESSITNPMDLGQYPSLMVIKEVQGKKVFPFLGKYGFRSTFALPETIRDNAPYTIDAWFINDDIALNECIADLTSSDDELEKIMVVNGTEPRCGVMNHFGWYEDAGYKDVADLAGKWQHLYVCFDGRTESVYINDELVSQKDIQLVVKPSQFVTLGSTASGEWPFTGSLHSLDVYDEYIPYNK